MVIEEALVDPSPQQIAKTTAAVDEDIKVVAEIWKAYMATTLTPEEARLAESYAENRKQYREKGLLPKKPLRALRGEGCADSMMTWRVVSMSGFFLRAYAPQRMNTTARWKSEKKPRTAKFHR